MYIGILQRGGRTDGQVSKMKVVAAPLLPSVLPLAIPRKLERPES
jgi:hypothetical protein